MGSGPRLVHQRPPSHPHTLTPSHPHPLTPSHPHTHTPSHPHRLVPVVGCCCWCAQRAWVHGTWTWGSTHMVYLWRFSLSRKDVCLLFGIIVRTILKEMEF